MPETPLIFKKAEIGNVPPPVREGGLFSSAMRRGSPRQGAVATDPTPRDSETQEVTGLLARPSSLPQAVPILENDVNAAAVHTRVALLVHAALGFRYCLLPLSALAVSGSVSVVGRASHGPLAPTSKARPR